MSRQPRYFRPTLEVLEDRALPSVAGPQALVPPPFSGNTTPTLAGQPFQGNAGLPGTLAVMTAKEAAFAALGASPAPGAYLNMSTPVMSHVAWTLNTSGDGVQQLASPMLWGFLA
jgi:hypothetical protein